MRGGHMPVKKKRNYRVEYDRYHGKPKQRKNRSMRNKARRKLKLKVGDKREVDHKRPLSKGGTNAKTNIRIVRRKSNRKKYNK
jgi:5-methylcytosine-specific restriction endonuclease McrA